MKRIKAKEIEVIIHEPVLKENQFFHSAVIKGLNEFKSKSDLIVANRMSEDIHDVKEKKFIKKICLMVTNNNL